MATTDTNKVVTVDKLGVAVRKIKQDYMLKKDFQDSVRSEVESVIAEYGDDDVDYATEQDILDLFDDDEGSTTEAGAGSGTATGDGPDLDDEL